MADPTMNPGGYGSDPNRPAPRDRRRDLRLVASGVVAVLLIWFAFANLQDVPIHFWVSSSKAPLIVVVIISALLGMATGALITRARRHRQRNDDVTGGYPGPGP
jgi:uncharacterized integral membrane protein